MYIYVYLYFWLTYGLNLILMHCMYLFLIKTFDFFFIKQWNFYENWIPVYSSILIRVT